TAVPVRGAVARREGGGRGRGAGRGRPAAGGGLGPGQTSSLRAFIGTARATLRAGLALVGLGSLVDGVTPCLGLVAGRRTTFSFKSPGITNWPGPFLPSSLAISSPIASNSLAMSFLPTPVFSARAL